MTTPRAMVRTLAVTTVAALALAACGQAEPERYVEPPVADSGVVLWPDYEDFLLEGNKAISVVTILRMEERHEDADILMRIAGTPQARWVGEWMLDDRIENITRNVYRAAADQERIAVITMAGIPGRGCSEITNYEDDAEGYLSRVRTSVQNLEDYDPETWFILEPGTIPNLRECGDEEYKIDLLNQAIDIITDAGAIVYVEAGTNRSIDPEETADRLLQLQLDKVAGFAFGTGTYDPDELERERGDQIMDLLKDEGFNDLGYILDTSRNGNGTVEEETCNPPGQAIGKAPRVMDDGYLDAYVWINRPGESDGTCNGGLETGDFSLPLGIALASNADPDNA